MKAMLLAAGKGDRLGEITRDVPKPMIRVRGKPILEHNIDLCARYGVRELCINLHHLPDAIRGYFGDGSRWGVSIRYKIEERLLGTAGGVKNFERDLEGAPFLVLYGDNLIDYDLGALMRRHAESKAEMSIAVFRLPDARLSGRVQFDADGRITDFTEKPKALEPIPGWVNAGVYAMNPELLQDIPSGPSDFGLDAIPRFLRRGRRLIAIPMDHKVVAVDTPELYRRSVESDGPSGPFRGKRKT